MANAYPRSVDDSLAGEFPGVTPQLAVPDADLAARFYRAAFGADELLRNHGRLSPTRGR
jgi:hypothetical protein